MANATLIQQNAEDTNAAWILTSTFVIFTMQCGYGLLESGFVQRKNATQVMMKQASAFIFTSISYWLFGYGLSFGPHGYNNPFCGEGNFVAQKSGVEMGGFYAHFLFHLALATTSTSIVSGAMAERTSLTNYIVFSFLNTLIYTIPAHWMWGEEGWLKDFGALDLGGSGIVHLLAAMSGLAAAVILEPRAGRYDVIDDDVKASKWDFPLGNSNQALFGMFTLWWGWLGINCGSAFSLATPARWMVAARAAVSTITASIAGGALALILSFLIRKRVYRVKDLIHGVLGALVAVSACCGVVHPWEGLIIGLLGSLLSLLTVPLLDKIGVDDPVGVVATHGIAGIWGLLATSFFADTDPVLGDVTSARYDVTRVGAFHGGGGDLFVAQLVAALSLIAWGGVLAGLLFFALSKTMGLRVTPEEEDVGADFVFHDITPPGGPPHWASGAPKIRRRHPISWCGGKEKLEIEGGGGENIEADSASTKM